MPAADDGTADSTDDADGRGVGGEGRTEPQIAQIAQMGREDAGNAMEGMRPTPTVILSEAKNLRREGEELGCTDGDGGTQGFRG